MSKDNLVLRNALQQAIAEDGGLRVFQHYGFEPSRRPQKNNPFRQERTSSFFVLEKFGKIIFKDFGDDSLKGDCRKFVQLYEQVDADNAFPILCEIYGLSPQSAVRSPQLRSKKAQSTIHSPQSNANLLDIQFKDFSQEELDFWWQKGFIDLKTLESNQVKSLKSFKIQTEKGKIREFANLSFVFGYEIVPQQVYKLYMPKPNYRVYAQAKTVFLPNLEIARKEFSENYAYSFGLETLDNQRPTILCGGEPDCLALKSAGYNAFTLGDERTSIPEYITHKISKSPNSKISILYDTDYTGLKNSYLLAKKLSSQRFVLPKLFKQTTKDAPKPDKNDLCDYLNTWGWDADLKLLLNQQIIHYQDFTIEYAPCFSVKKYLSEKTDLLAQFIQNHKRIQTDADAGVGKTYTMLIEMPQKLQKPMLFVVPFAIQVEQIEQEYKELIPDLVCFTNSSIQSADNEEFNLVGRPIGNVNVCTYDRIKQVFERLRQDFDNDIIVVVDESHLLTSEYAYRTRAIHDVIEVCQTANRVVYLSATPDYALCQFSGFRLIRFKRQENPQINITALDYEGEPKKNLLKLLLNERMSELANEQSEESKFLSNRQSDSSLKLGMTNNSNFQSTNFITIVRLNNKTLARVIARMLVEKKLYQANEIDFVFSEKRRGVSTPAKDSIVNQSLIPENVRLLFVTACFDCGINIQNTNIQQIISFETRYTDNCLDTFKQFIARFRNLENVNISVCKPLRFKVLPELKSRVQLYERLAQDAQNKLNLLEYNDLPYQNYIQQKIQEVNHFGLASPKTPRYIKVNTDISATFKLLIQNPDKQSYKINYNYIRFTLKDYERKSLDSNNYYNNLLLDLPNTFLINRKILNADKKDVNSLILNDLIQKEKEQRKERVEQICKIMSSNPQNFFDSVHAEYRDVSLKEQIKRQFTVSSVKDAPKLETIINGQLTMNNEQLTVNNEQLVMDNEHSPIIHCYDEEITELSHRYFYLNDLLIPKTKIPELLKNNADDVNYGILTKTLVNHINLLAKQKSGKNFPNLVNDSRKLEDIHWLELLISEVNHWKSKIYEQKKSAQLKRNLDNLNYDLKLLQYERRNTQMQTLGMILKIQAGEKLRSPLRLLKRKLKSFNNRVPNLQTKIKEAEIKYQNSLVKGLEINELSDRMNHLRSSQADWQGLTANLRLLGSLFEIRTCKRLIFNQNEYTEKYVVEIGKALSFREILAKFGFKEEETQNYLDYLNYQIELDLETNRQIWSKNEQISLKSANHEFDLRSGSFGKIEHFDQNKDYPSFWDE